MLGGLGIGAVSLLPSVLAYVTQPDAVRHEHDLVLISDADIAQKLPAAAFRRNQVEASRCATTADLPLSPALERAMGSAARPPAASADSGHPMP